MTTVTFNEVEALRYPLFQDDFGEPGDKVLSDHIVTARKTHKCLECLSPIQPGSRQRVHTGKYSGRVWSYHICECCCAAMAVHFQGQPEAIEARWKIRNANIQAERAPTA